MMGKTISHYKILEQLGQGGMGIVYKAEDTKLHRPVALKVLPRQALISEEDKTRFAREAQAAASLSHPNVAMIHEFDEVDDPVTGGTLAFIAMEYVDGETVKQKINERPLPIDEALKIAIAVAEGLAEAHGKGIVHRDIKSENVMISRSGVVKIMDFGLAEVAGRSRVTKEGMTVGTVSYMSPEQALGERLDQRTDIWSLGVVLYEMITGRLPFAGDYEQAIVYGILNEEPEPVTSLRSNVPMELERIVKKAMQKDRSTRYQTASDLLADLRSLTKGLESGTRVQVTAKKIRLQKRHLYLYGGLLAVAAMVVVAVLSIVPRPGEVIDSIAVLPLTNLMGDPEQEYFVEGMHEALTAELSKISALKVISRTSAMQYKDVKRPMPQIARELGVNGLIEGSVLREGDQVRITVQLIHGPTDRHLWAESYQRELRGILTLQSEVAQGIAREIRVKVSLQEQARLARGDLVNPEVYRLYLQGRYHWNKRTKEGFYKAISFFEQAIEKDPNYALAYVGVADSYLTLGDWAYLPPQEALPKIKANAIKALSIDDRLGEAHTSLAWAYYILAWDWSSAEGEFQRAVELKPSYATLHQWYAEYLSSRGRHEEAIKEIKRAQELDPLSLIINTMAGHVFYTARLYDQAIEQYQRTIDLDSSFVLAHVYLGLAYAEKSMFEEAIAEFQRAMKLSKMKTTLFALGYGYAVSGKRDQAMKMLEELTKLSKQEHVPNFYYALIYTGLRDHDRAFAYLEKGLEEHETPILAYLGTVPSLDPLRSDSRFKKLLRRMNFPEN